MCDFWEELLNEGRKEAEEQANAQAEQANAQAEQAIARAEQAKAEAEQAKAEAEQAKAEAERAYAQVESVKQNARSYPIKTAICPKCHEVSLYVEDKEFDRMTGRALIERKI